MSRGRGLSQALPSGPLDMRMRQERHVGAETWVDKAVAEERITPREGQDFISNFQRGLYGYTYLE